MFVCMFQGQLQLQYHPRTVEPSLREKIVKKVGINFFSKINLLCENITLVIVFVDFSESGDGPDLGAKSRKTRLTCKLSTTILMI